MKNTLYDKIKEKEDGINDIERSIEVLNKKEFEVKGEVPVLEEEIDKLLSNEDYKNNSVVQRLRAGEKLEPIVQGIASKRKYSLKFNRKKRDKFNEEVNELKPVIPFAYYLRKQSIFNPVSGPESLGTYLALFGASTGILTGWIDSNDWNLIWKVSSGFGGALGLVGALVGYSIDSTKKTLSTLKDKFQYIDKIRGKK